MFPRSIIITIVNFIAQLLLMLPPPISMAGPFGLECVNPFKIEEEKAHMHQPERLSSNGSKHRYVVEKASYGFITSHGYPENYGNQKCSVELSAPFNSGLVIHLSFIDLDVEPKYSRSAQCLRDYIVITIIDRDGREHTSERICGNERPRPLQSMQSRARILFIASSTSFHLLTPNSTSKRTLRRRGFRLKYDFVAEATILAPSSFYYDSDRRFISDCGGVNSPTDLSGEIRSPGFPFTYPRNITCNWLLRVAPHHRLYIRLLDMELSPTVELEGEEASYSPQQQLRSQAGPVDARFCGGSLYYKEEGMKSFLSERNRVIVRFTTHGNPSPKQLNSFKTSGKSIGFRLVWTEVDSLIATSGDDLRTLTPAGSTEFPALGSSLTTAEQCDGFVCHGGEFCVDAADNICVDRTRLCINETLRCDGMPNCAENDDSDETYCYSQNALSLITVVLFLITLISFFLCFICYSLNYLRRRTPYDARQRRSSRQKNGKTAHRVNLRSGEQQKQIAEGRWPPPSINIKRAEAASTTTKKKERGSKITEPSKKIREANGNFISINGRPEGNEQLHKIHQKLLPTISGTYPNIHLDDVNTNGSVMNGLEEEVNGDQTAPCNCPIGAIPKVSLFCQPTIGKNNGCDIWERRKSDNGIAQRKTLIKETSLVAPDR